MSLSGVWTVQAYLSCLIINRKMVDIATNRFYFFLHISQKKYIDRLYLHHKILLFILT